MKKSAQLLITLYIVLLISACASGSKINKAKSELESMIRGSTVFNKHFTGFVLYDPVTKTSLANYQGSKYFTPASNTKILTLYTALSILTDSLPSFRYQESNDQMIIKGLGDPTLLHPLWPDHSGWQKIKNANKLSLVHSQLQDQSWGSGWAWDDYIEAYQAEKSDLPLYGNLVRFREANNKTGYQVFPTYFQNKWSSISTFTPGSKVNRSFTENEFRLTNPDSAATWHLPYRTDHQTVKHLLEDTLHHPVQSVWSNNVDESIPWKIAYGVPVDSVYAQMMKVSDNFIAEQLLLVCSAYLFDTMNTSKMIEYANLNLFRSVPDTLQWYDGSGLSRYNLFTPNSIVYILEQVKNKISWERIKRIFPAGGVSGTLKNWYPGFTQPYIYAKTGSLMNNHALSGYLQTQSGRVLIFSFMHSNYIGSVNPIRMEMRKILEYIRDHI